MIHIKDVSGRVTVSVEARVLYADDVIPLSKIGEDLPKILDFATEYGMEVRFNRSNSQVLVLSGEVV